MYPDLSVRALQNVQDTETNAIINIKVVPAGVELSSMLGNPILCALIIGQSIHELA